MEIIFNHLNRERKKNEEMYLVEWHRRPLFYFYEKKSILVIPLLAQTPGIP